MATITEITTNIQTGEVTVTTRERTQADMYRERESDESMRRFIAEIHGGGSLFDEADKRAAEKERRAARRAARKAARSGTVPAVTPARAPGSLMDLYIRSREAALASRNKPAQEVV